MGGDSLSMQTTNIIYNKIYQFDLTNQVCFGSLGEEELYSLFRDGRVVSHFLQILITKWFPELRFVDGKGFDHLDDSNLKYELKGFTKGGCKLLPSNQIGQGRKANPVLWKEHVQKNNLSYIITDIVDFPKIKLIFKRGTDLTTTYPSGIVSVSQKGKFYEVSQ